MRKGYSSQSDTKRRKRLYHKDSSIIRLRPQYPNHIWSIDFVHDKLSNGRSYKMLTVLDEHTRQAPCVHVKTKMGAAEVLEALYQLIIEHGKPEYIRSDNGPEFVASALQEWLIRVGIKPIQIYPGSPWENGYNERFNGTLRNGSPERGVVRNHQTGTNRHQSVAKAIQSYPTTSGPEHETAGPRNSIKKWPITRGLYRSNYCIIRYIASLSNFSIMHSCTYDIVLMVRLDSDLQFALFEKSIVAISAE